MNVIVSKEDLEAANKAVIILKEQIDNYMRTVRTILELNRRLMETWEAQQVEIERLRARLSEFEVQ